jgi:hypothetical protein
MVIATEMMVRRGDDPRYKISVVNDTDLPRRIFLVFADVDRDQQQNSTMSQRSADAVDSARELTVDLSNLALTTTEAKRLVERLIRRRWFAREIVENKITAMELALEPADTDTLELDGTSIGVRLTKMVIGADGVLTCRWERDIAAMATLSTSPGTISTGRPVATLPVSIPSKGFVLDIPLLSDAHDQSSPFLYLAAGPYGSGTWFGADIWGSDSGGVDDYDPGFDSIPSTDGVSWGITTTVLGDGVPYLIDESSAGVTVDMKNGTLTSVTETQMLNDKTLNLAIIGSPDVGWELIQFQTATLLSGTTYQLTGINRGVRGTEDYIGGHAIGDQFVLVSDVIKMHSLGAAEIGDTDYYVALSQGRPFSPIGAIAVEFASVPNKPLSPVHLAATKDSGSGDWTMTWIRRTRIGGGNVDGQDVPLGETSESYKVQIMDGSTVVRTITASTETAVWTEAQQISDFGSDQATISFRVLQVSPALSLDGFYRAGSA